MATGNDLFAIVIFVFFILCFGFALWALLSFTYHNKLKQVIFKHQQFPKKK